MHQDARRAQFRDDAMRQVAGAFRGAAGQHHHVAFGKRLAHRFFQRRLVVGKGTHGDRLAASFGDRGGNDGAIAVIDAGGAQRLAWRHQLVAGGKHRDVRPPHHGDARQPAGGEHADLARADARALTQQRLAAGDVGAGEGDELPGPDGAAQLDGRRPCRR